MSRKSLKKHDSAHASAHNSGKVKRAQIAYLKKRAQKQSVSKAEGRP